MSEVAVLIATKGRGKYLVERSLPSVFSQTIRPNQLIVVSDYLSIDSEVEAIIFDIAAQHGIRTVLIGNQRTPGLSGAINTGLELLARQGYRGYVAIIDDDDTWDDDHIEMNLYEINDFNVSVSGLRLCIDNKISARPLLKNLCSHSFLVGNPGWQGSNTFITLEHLIHVGGYREGLTSLTDRDLAIRVLKASGTRCRVVPRWTATWYADTPDALSSPGSSAKREGLQSFWSLYKNEMSEIDRNLFFERAKELFGINQEEIVVDSVLCNGRFIWP